MKMNQKIMLNLFPEERQNDTNKMIQSLFHEMMTIIQMMKDSSQKARRETTHKKGLENKDPTLEKHKLSASRKS